MPAERIGPSLADLVAEPERHRAERERTTVFDSTGWALQDRVAIQLLLHHANRLDLRVFMELEAASDDPLSPYQFGPERHDDSTKGAET